MSESFVSNKSFNLKESKWLTAYQQKSINLNTFNGCICLSNLNLDNDYHLLIGNLSENFIEPNLLIFKGVSLKSEIKLEDFPIGIVNIYLDQNNLKVPLIVIASSYSIFIYKNLKPFYKFTLPSIEINVTESDAWEQAKNDKIDVNILKELLLNLRLTIGESSLTACSQFFLKLDNLNEMMSFVEDKKKYSLRKMNLITCINTIVKSNCQDEQLCYLVVGTENCDLFIIEPEAFTIIFSSKLPAIPVFIEVSGEFHIEFRIIVSCRNSCIYTIKREFKKPRLTVQLSSHCCGMVKVNNNLMVTCLDNTLNCFNLKGNCLWSIKHNSFITAITTIFIEMFELSLTAIALNNKEIIFYNDKNIVDKLLTDEIITSLKFGKYGREDNTLILINQKGNLEIKFLKRTIKFHNLSNIKNNLNEVANNNKFNKFSIQKKTKVFINQTLRERENPIEIYKTFQRDLYHLKLISARAYIKAINCNLNPISFNSQYPIKLHAQVHGLGPIFKLVLEIQNISADKPISDLITLFNFDSKIYKLIKTIIFVPFLVPGKTYSFQNKIEAISELNLSGQIKILITKKHDKHPLVTATVNMPKSINFRFD